MNFSSIITKNIKHNIRSYLAYLIGNSIIETILFLFLNLTFGDSFKNADESFPVKSNMGEMIILMVMFSVIFIFYTTITYTKTRGKEFGVYFTIGLTTKEIIRILLFENILISGISFLASSLSGSLFYKLFHIAICRILRVENVDFSFTLLAFLGIAVISVIICLFSTLYQYIFLRRNSVAAVFKSKTKKNVGKTGKVLGFIGIVLLIASLYMFNGALYNKFNSNLMPVSMLCAGISIYILLGFFMTFIVLVMKKWRKVYNNNILFFTSISYKFKAYQTILFVVTLLVVLAVGFIGVSYSKYRNTREVIEERMPYDLSFISKDNTINYKKIVEETIGEVKECNILEGINVPEIRLHEGEALFRSINMLLIKAGDYKENFNLEDDKALYIRPNNAGSFLEAGFVIDLNHKKFYGEDITEDDLNSSSNSIRYEEDKVENEIGAVVNSLYTKRYERFSTLVVSDNVYERVLESLGRDKITYEVQINLNNADVKKVKDLREKLNEVLGDDIGDTVTCKEEEFNESIVDNSFTFFVFSFLGIMFLAGSGAVLYFKTMTSIEEEKEDSDKLLKLGLTQKEVEKLWVKELLAIFFVPAILGVTITGYFLNSIYTAVFVQGYWFDYTLVVFAVYIVLQGIFFLLTCNHYKRVMRK